jgi:hypothetical protein
LFLLPRTSRNKKTAAKRQGKEKALAEIHLERKASDQELERAQNNSDRIKAEDEKLKNEKTAANKRVAATQDKAEAARGEWLDAAKTAHSPSSLLKSCIEDCRDDAAAPKPAAARSATGTVETLAPVQKPAAGLSATGTVEQAAPTVETPAPK